MAYSYEKYIDKLQGEYLDEFMKVDKCIKSSNLNDDEIEEAMYKILDLFIKGENEESPVSEITSGNIKKFCSNYTYELTPDVKRSSKMLIGGIGRLVILIVCMTIISFVNLSKGITKGVWRGVYDIGNIGCFIIVSICTSLLINFFVYLYKAKGHDDKADKLKKYDLFVSVSAGILLMVIKMIFRISVNTTLEWISGCVFCGFVCLLLIDEILWNIRVYSNIEAAISKNVREIRNKFSRRSNNGRENITMKEYLKSYSSNRVMKKWLAIIGAALWILFVFLMFYFDGIKAIFDTSYLILIMLPCFGENQDHGIIKYIFNFKYESRAIERLRELNV